MWIRVKKFLKVSRSASCQPLTVLNRSLEDADRVAGQKTAGLPHVVDVLDDYLQFPGRIPDHNSSEPSMGEEDRKRVISLPIPPEV